MPKNNPNPNPNQKKNRLINQALRFLGYRSRSTHELTQYLQKKTSDSQLIQSVLDHLQDLDLIDDQLFASQYAQSLLRNKHKGPRYISQKLKQLGINRHQTDIAIATLPATDQIESAIIVLSKHNRKIAQYPPHQQQLKAQQYLYNAGFSPDISRSAIDEYYQDE